MAPQILEVIIEKSFKTNKGEGYRDHSFIKQVSGSLVCLVCTCLWVALKQWETGVYDPKVHMGTLPVESKLAPDTIHLVTGLFL